MSSTLVQPFLDSVPVPLRPGFAAMVDLELHLSAMIERARTAWPDIDVPLPAFVAFAGQRLSEDHKPHDALSQLRAAELYLTCACDRGDHAAITAFDRRYVSEIDVTLSRMRISPSQVDEIKQLVRQKLFVGSDGTNGKIGSYKGRGDLRNWVQLIAKRTCLNHIRKHKREFPMEDDVLLAGMSDSADDPEIAYIKEKYRNEFVTAFASAVRSLPARDQNLLRHYHVDGLNIDELGSIYHVHRVTAYRWLEKARAALMAETMRLMQTQLNVDKRELKSILRMIRTQLHISLRNFMSQKSKADSGSAPGGAEV